MKQLKYFVAALAVAMTAIACSDDDDFRDSIISTTPEPQTEVDKWIRSNFGVYNIDVIYKWHDFETNQEYDLTPPDESRVVPCLSVIQRIWMKPYIELGGELFFKKTAPKQLMLLGSEGYLEDGNTILGEAEQGMRITLYNLNSQNPKNDNVVSNYTHTFHHEFVHILHQLVKYPTAYEALCSDKYTQSWQSYHINTALGLGFINPYAMENANEDFAEMIARFIIFDASTWQAQFNQAQSQSIEGYRILREKETLILQYMQSVWGIDLYKMRELVHRELELIEEENAQEP
ncbi:putative zinc-binding metallopeptidase [Alistipes sp. OttesenSCG-928-B03]|nr:putative zinc-binding metallopeptidase [Alistipes sp. OttesenSCG-928-B03]